MNIKRNIEIEIRNSLRDFPVTAILGPRQVGKTTLAKKLCQDLPGALYLDLEKPSDLAKLDDAEFYLREHQDRLICLDEIQRRPELFPIMRALVDEKRRSGKFLVLGSASPILLRQTSESLAGRIAFHELSPCFLSELSTTSYTWKDLLVRGGFPDSIFAPSDAMSMRWRENFLLSFIERDLAMLGIDCQPALMRRLWLMVAHMNGQQMNLSKLAQSLDITHPTVKRYLDILCGTYMLKSLEPYLVNIKRRLVKTPKYYLADSGIFNALLELENFEDVYNHPAYGSLWEGLAIQQLIEKWQPKQPYGYFRSHGGEEIDLLFRKKSTLMAFEFKTSTSPKIDAKILPLLDELGIEQLQVITPESEKYTLFGARIQIQSLSEEVNK